MSGLSHKRLLNAVGSSMGARIGTAGLSYGLFWGLSHRLATDALGGFSLLMNLFLLLQTLPMLGLSIPLWRRSAAEPRHLRREISNAIAFALPVAALIGVAVGIAGHWVHGTTMKVPFWLLGASMLPTAWTLIAESSLLGREHLVDVARINFAESLARSVLMLAAVWLGAGLGGMFCIFLLLRIAVAGLYLAHPAMPRPRPRLVSRAIQRRNLGEIPVFMGIVLMSATAGRLDVIALAQLRGLHDAAIYSAASRLYDATLMIPTVTALAVMPVLARQFASADRRFIATLEVAVRLGLVVGLGVALVVAALAQPVIGLLYRPEMSGSAPVLRWLIFASVLMVGDTILSSAMLAAKAQSHDLRSLGVALAVLVVALLTLPIGFGPPGAAAAVVLAMTVRVLWRLRWAALTLGMTPWPGIARIAASCAIGVGGLMIGLQVSVGAALAGGLLAYVAAVLATGVFGRRPWHGLRVELAQLSGRVAPVEG